MNLPTRLGFIEAGLATLTDTDARKILAGDASMALRHLRPLPLECWQHVLRLEQSRLRPRQKLVRLLTAAIDGWHEGEAPASSIEHPASSIQHRASSLPQHGGPRTPGPGKRIGRPKKPKKDKVAILQITLSSPKARRELKRKARKARLTPGALIERELGL